MLENLKSLIKRILPQSVIDMIRQYRQRKKDYLWLEENVFPKIKQDICLEDEYEEQSKELLTRYKRIEICTIISNRVGEIIVALGFQSVFPPKDGELAVFIPVGWIPNFEGLQYLYDDRYIANTYLFGKVAQLFPIVTRDNAGFWKYFIQRYKSRTYFSHRYDRPNLLQMQKKIIMGKNFHRIFLRFDVQERKSGDTQLKHMGIQGEYVCFFARSARYLKEFLGKIDLPGNAVRNSHIANFGLMSERLWDKGIQSVRMGYLVEGAFAAPGGIDYANKFRTEFMDFYILSKAKFLVSGPSAMQVMANLFDKPLVMINQPVFTFNADSLNYCDRKQDILLPKKMYDTVNKRYLTFKEIFAIERQEDSRYKIAEYYDAHGIVLEENTPEEIADAAEEMLERLNGTFKYNPEDEARQKRFSELLAWACEGRDCFVVDLPVGRNFLRQNDWLLE